MFKKYFASVPKRFLPLFAKSAELWEPLNRLETFITENIKPGNKGKIFGDVFIEDNVEIGEGTVIEHGAVIKGPTIIGKNCEIRAGAYIRGNVVCGDNTTIGHTTEVKESILLDGVRIDHFTYCGDSILGNKVHFGAGAKIANLRFDGKNIFINNQDTEKRKFGAILGDECQLGVNACIGPGVIFERETWYAIPNLLKPGIYNKDSIRHNA